MGVAEHVFDMSVHGRTVRWHLYDVGGARGQRHSWIPYFDDAYVFSSMFVSGSDPHDNLRASVPQSSSWRPSARSIRFVIFPVFG